jgi:hypothetical protein
MKIWIAAIEHGYGVNLLASLSWEGLQRQIYRYVKNWWFDLGLSKELPEDMDEAISFYFDNNPGNEGLAYELVELESEQ